jgi:autotransporter family porin
MGVGTFIDRDKLPINRFKGGCYFKDVILFSGLILLLTIVLAGAASASTIPVTPGNNAIKNAISSASDGDTLDLSAGTYNEHDIMVNKNLTITGPKTTNHSPPTAVVDAQKLGRVFLINPGINANLQYLLIQNGKSSKGGGIYVNHSSTLNIKNCSLQKNYATYGGAIYTEYATTTIMSGSIIYKNSAIYGGGIASGASVLTLIDSIIYNNIADTGGAINNCCSELTVYHSNMYNNTAQGYGYGGAIFNLDGRVKLYDSNIYNNNAKSGGAVRCSSISMVSNIEFNNCNLYNNVADYGGGIYNNGGLDYDGIFVNSIVKMINSKLFNNHAIFGGAIYNNQGKLTVLNSNIFQNSARTGGGINNNNGTITLFNSNVYKNTALNGNGGGINNEYRSDLILTNSNVYSNRAPLGIGGGIYNTNYSTNVMSTSNLSRNTAKYGGGMGNSIYGKAYLSFCRIVGNYALYGRDIYNSMAKNRGKVTAKLNWWGSNSNPTSKVLGAVNITPWLVLTLTATPSHIENGGTSSITAHIIRDSNGVFHNPSMGHVPNGILVNFKTTLGTLKSPLYTVNGISNTILNSGSAKGVADVSAIVDGQILHKSVTIGTPPIVMKTDPSMNKVNVYPYKIIKITFSEPIKAGNMWIELKSSSGKSIPITFNIINNVLTIKHSNPMAKATKYTLIFHTGSITDVLGNPVASYISYFKTA